MLQTSHAVPALMQKPGFVPGFVVNHNANGTPVVRYNDGTGPRASSGI